VPRPWRGVDPINRLTAAKNSRAASRRVASPPNQFAREGRKRLPSEKEREKRDRERKREREREREPKCMRTSARETTGDERLRSLAEQLEREREREREGGGERNVGKFNVA